MITSLIRFCSRNSKDFLNLRHHDIPNVQIPNMILETNFHEPAISIEIKKVTEFILLHFGNTVTKYQS